MSRRHTQFEIDKIILLRQEGKTISELVKILGIPKTTIWHHIHNVELSLEVSNKLRSRKGGSHVRSLKAWQQAGVFAQELLKGENSELVRAVAMLYWAEGHKKDFVFTNTDVKMLMLYINFLKIVLKINSANIKILVRTSIPIEVKKAKSYWSKSLSLPSKNFTSNHDTVQRRTKTEYGICRVMVVKSSFYHKVMISLISEIQKDFNMSP